LVEIIGWFLITWFTAGTLPAVFVLVALVLLCE